MTLLKDLISRVVPCFFKPPATCKDIGELHAAVFVREVSEQLGVSVETAWLRQCCPWPPTDTFSREWVMLGMFIKTRAIAENMAEETAQSIISIFYLSASRRLDQINHPFSSSHRSLFDKRSEEYSRDLQSNPKDYGVGFLRMFERFCRNCGIQNPSLPSTGQKYLAVLWNIESQTAAGFAANFKILPE